MSRLSVLRLRVGSWRTKNCFSGLPMYFSTALSSMPNCAPTWLTLRNWPLSYPNRAGNLGSWLA